MSAEQKSDIVTDAGVTRVLAEIAANDHAASLVGIPDEDIEARHEGFDDVARMLIVQSIGAPAELGRKAYQLLLEMYALGASPPAHIDLPSLVWEFKSEHGVLTFGVRIKVDHWDVDVNGANQAGRRLHEAAQWQCTVRELARQIMIAFRGVADEGGEGVEGDE